MEKLFSNTRAKRKTFSSCKALLFLGGALSLPAARDVSVIFADDGRIAFELKRQRDYL